MNILQITSIEQVILFLLILSILDKIISDVL